MMYVRGQAIEYNDWARITGYKSWTWAGLKPFFLKHEGMTVPAEDQVYPGSKMMRFFESEFHGSSGPIKTSFGNSTVPAVEAWIEAGKTMGFEWTPTKDTWSGSHMGGYASLSTIDRSQGPGTRSYSVTGYLTPNSARPNLKVLTEANVAKVILDQNAEIPTATGVTFLSNGKEFAVYAKREVVLSAGTMKTPQILELSGIGKPNLLKSVGLQCIIGNERVGEQFHDHILTLLSYDLVDGEKSLDELTQEAVMGEAMRKYGLGEGGPLANSCNALAFLAVAQIATPEEMVRINDAVKLELESPSDQWTKAERKILAERINDPKSASIQMGVLPLTVNPARFDDQTKLLAPGVGRNKCSMFVALSHPFSKGSIHIQNKDPTTQPEIDPQYLQSRVDVEVLSVGLRVADDMFRTKPLADKIRSRIFPSADMDMQDPSQREEYLRAHVGTEYHPCGTAALGQVVDEQLIVFGVKGLRVVDASIMPLISSGNIVAPVYAIAEKAADLVRSDQ